MILINWRLHAPLLVFLLVVSSLLPSLPAVAVPSDQPTTPPISEFSEWMVTPQPAGEYSNVFSSLPFGPDGKPYIVRTTTSYGYTRPELLGNPVPLKTAQPLDNIGFGSEGVVHQGFFPAPFGEKGEQPGIALMTGMFTPPAGEKIQPALLELANSKLMLKKPSDTTPSVYGFIVLNSWLTESLQNVLTANGIQLIRHYPVTAYQAKIPADKLGELANIPEILWVGQVNPNQKLNPLLNDFINQSTNEIRELYVTLFGDDSDGAEQQLINQYGGEIGMYNPRLETLFVKADADTARAILNMNSVLHVEPVPISHAGHTQSQTTINADRVWGIYDGRPVDGRAIKVGVMDTGLNINHVDFSELNGGWAGYNRTSETNWWDDQHGHGTHVSGTFFGEGNAQFRYRGTAAGVQDTDVAGYDLLFSKVFNSAGSSVGDSVYQGLLDMQGRAADLKRRVFNYSGWASGIGQLGTDANSRLVDEIFQDNILPFICAGNGGPTSQSIGSPAVAKGAFAVGNIWDDGETTVDTMASDSSRGPTGDNRVKPDVVAPGRWIDSCSNTVDNGYKFGWNGTSMATPHAAGLATGLIQHYDFPAWTIKSIILASAIDLGLGSANQGRGKVDTLLAHYNTDGGWSSWWASNGATGDLSTRDFTLTTAVAQLRIVLVYPDAPAASGAAYALKNDLDLRLDKEPFSADQYGEWASNSSRDNVEIINVYNAQPGNYRIKVYSYAQNEGSSQAWAVTKKEMVGSTSPNLTLSLTAPVAVKPNVDFNVTGSATANSYVASGVFGKMTLLTAGTTLNGMTFKRRSPAGGTETVYFDGESGMNQGNIGDGYTRSLDWSLKATTTGTKTIRYNASSSNGGSGSVTKTIMVDGTNPTNWQGNLPTVWVSDQTPNCSIKVQDTYSGLDVDKLYYYYYDGTINGPFDCTTSVLDGETALSTINALAVPFNQDGGYGANQVYYRAYDQAGNYSDSGWKNVNIDTVAPAYSGFVPSGQTTITNPNCSVQVRDITSGLDISYGAYYRYSTDGAATWSAWSQTDVTGVDGTTGFQTITATTVPFNQVSLTQNKIQFAIADQAGNWGSYSPIYNVSIVKGVTITARLKLGSYIGSVHALSTVPIKVYLNGTETIKYLTGTGTVGTFTIPVVDGVINVLRVHPGGYLAQKKLFIGDSPLTITFYGPDGTTGLKGGDTNWDNSIDDFDLNNVNGEFGGPPSGVGFTDINGDGVVDDFELNFVNGSFGETGDPI